MIGATLLKFCLHAGVVIPLILLVSCGKEEWDYVVLGDSSAWGFPEYYAAHIEEDLGVKVTVHDWTVGSE